MTKVFAVFVALPLSIACLGNRVPTACDLLPVEDIARLAKKIAKVGRELEGRKPSRGWQYAIDARVNRRAADLVVAARSVPGRPRLRRGVLRLGSATAIWALAPEVPAGTESLELSARRPDGSSEVLLLAERPPADWPPGSRRWD